MRIVPNLLLYGDSAYRSIAFTSNIYLGCPLNAVRLLDTFGVPEICISVPESANLDTIKSISSTICCPLTVIGMWKSTNLDYARKSGVDRVGFQINPTDNLSCVQRACSEFGKQGVCVSIYLSDLTMNDIDFNHRLFEFLSRYCGEIYLIDKTRVGSKRGVSSSLIKYGSLISTSYDVNVGLFGGFSGEDIGFPFSSILASSYFTTPNRGDGVLIHAK